jgi:hypothetical protein
MSGNELLKYLGTLSPEELELTVWTDDLETYQNALSGCQVTPEGLFMDFSKSRL